MSKKSLIARTWVIATLYAAVAMDPVRGSSAASLQSDAWMGQWTIAPTMQSPTKDAPNSTAGKVISLNELTISQKADRVVIIGRSPLESDRVELSVSRRSADSVELKAINEPVILRLTAKDAALTIEVLGATGSGVVALTRQFVRPGKPGMPGMFGGTGATPGMTSGGSGGASGGSNLPIIIAVTGGAIAVAGVVVALNDAEPPCSFEVTPTTLSAAPAGGTFGINISTSCQSQSWTSSVSAPFLSLSPSSGTGSGVTTLTVLANGSGSDRTGTVTIAGQTVTVSQSAALCVEQPIQSQGAGMFGRMFDLGRNSGTFEFRYDSGTSEDQFVLTYQGWPLFDSGCVATNATRVQVISFAGDASTLGVTVNGNCASRADATAWNFSLSCPR